MPVVDRPYPQPRSGPYPNPDLDPGPEPDPNPKQAEPSTASVALARRLESFIGGGAEVGMEEKCSSSSAQVGAEGGARCAEGGSTEDLAPADPGTAAVVAAVATALRRHREGGSKYPV